MRVAVDEGRRSLEERCPLCRTALDAPGRALARCVRCGTEAHADCAAELNGGRCAVLGCAWPGARSAATTNAEAPVRRGRRARPRLLRSAALLIAGCAALATVLALATRPPAPPHVDRCGCGVPLHGRDFIHTHITDRIR